MSEFTSKYIEIMKRNSLEAFSSVELAERFEALTIRMLSVNEQMNLTAIRDIDGIILKHYADSLSAAPLIDEGAKLIDVGCGAGFPSLPLAIARPDLRITALDSTAKRINYISETAEILSLTNITAIAARAEDAARLPELRESFDVSCARAVARLNALSELCLPFVRIGGKFIAMKANSDDEVKEAERGISKLGGRIKSVERISLCDLNGESNPRALIKIKKISKTPENYPRNWSQISKKPL